MAIRKVARLGHPVLRQATRTLSREEIGSDWLKQLVGDMLETMREYGGIGLAAPQIHESLRLALIEIPDDSERYPGSREQALECFVNPVITVLDPATRGFWEGCLSIPEIRGFVERPRAVKVEYLSLGGEERTLHAEGFLATVVQHELDHLDGKLFVDRIRDTSKLAFLEEYRRYHLEKEIE